MEKRPHKRLVEKFQSFFMNFLEDVRKRFFYDSYGLLGINIPIMYMHTFGL